MHTRWCKWRMGVEEEEELQVEYTWVRGAGVLLLIRMACRMLAS